MKTILLAIFVTLSTQLYAQKTMKTIHDFNVKSNDGKEFDLSTLKGKKVMIVNTASECGYTPQYEQLEELYKKYKNNGFVIIAFPSNDFGGQEPGSDEQIAQFCQKNYGVTFPIMSKVDIKGDNVHPLYKFLTSKNENGVADAEVKWNFNKFLIDEEGRVVEHLPSKEKPNSEHITNWIEGK